jgi:hypothetical protein
MKPLLPQRIEGIASPRLADERTLRLCMSEQDAVVASIRLSGLTLDEIAARIGVTKQAVSKWQGTGVPAKRLAAFQNATGVRLVQQYLDMERAFRIARGLVREQDRIDAIVAPTQQAWAVGHHIERRRA